MSELKVIDLDDIRKAIENDQSVYYEYYAKPEADKVIAKLTNEIEEQKRLRDMALASMPNVLKVMKIIQHHKYKRCLAMAEWCDAEADVADADGDYEDMRWYQKWHERWLKLAEQFKED